MVDTSYNIRTKSNGELQIPFNTASVNGWTVGETATFTFEFDVDVTFSSDYTVSGTEVYGIVFVPAGVTLTVPSGSVLQTEELQVNGTVTGDGLVNIQSGARNAINDYMEWAGSWATLEMLDNSLKYKIQIPTDAGIDSLVWGIEPNQTLQDRGLVGVWGLVESISNERNKALTTNRYAVDVTVLAPIDEYATIDDVESDLVI